MKRRWKIYLAVLVALVVAVEVADYLRVETKAFAWHLQHGFHFEFGEIRVKVPLSYEARYLTGSSLLISRSSGHLWHGAGGITLDFGKHPSSAARQAAMAMLPNASPSLKRKKVGEQPAVFAGRLGNCIESIPEVEQAGLQELFKKADMRDIECSFGDDGEAMFIGWGNLKGDFYDIIQTAEPVKGKL